MSHLQSEIDDSAELLQPLKFSSVKLSRLLSSTVNSPNITFSDINTKVRYLKKIKSLSKISSDFKG